MSKIYHGFICPRSRGKRRVRRKRQGRSWRWQRRWWRLRTETIANALISAPEARLVAFRADLPQRESQRRLLDHAVPCSLLPSNLLSSAIYIAILLASSASGTDQNEIVQISMSHKFLVFFYFPSIKESELWILNKINIPIMLLNHKTVSRSVYLFIPLRYVRQNGKIPI